MAQKQGLLKGLKEFLCPATPGSQVVSLFESHYLPHIILISSDEQKLSYRITYNVQSGSEKISINYAIPTIPLNFPIYYLPQPQVLCTII